MEQDSECRYWVHYDLERNVAVLYQQSFSGFFFQRWDTNKWVDASDRYLRITRDAACDEVSIERAQQILSEFAEKELPTDSYNGEGFSALASSSIAMHEVFLELLSAGFTEDQALKIIVGLLRPE